MALFRIVTKSFLVTESKECELAQGGVAPAFEPWLAQISFVYRYRNILPRADNPLCRSYGKGLPVKEVQKNQHARALYKKKNKPGLLSTLKHSH